MNRSVSKQDTDLLNIVHLTLDQVTDPAALDQISSVESTVAQDIIPHIDL